MMRRRVTAKMTANVTRAKIKRGGSVTASQRASAGKIESELAEREQQHRQEHRHCIG
jgi:hypothetical protein